MHSKEVGNVVIEFVTIIVGALTGRALVAVVAGLGNAVAALGAFITAVRTGALVAGSFAAALGPIGLIAGGAAAAVYLLVDGANASETAILNANTAIAGNATALDRAKESSNGYTSALRDQIQMQYTAARASFELAYAESLAARARADNFRAMTKSLTGYELSFDPFDYAARTSDANATAIGKAALKIGEQLKFVNEQMDKQPSGFGKGSGAAPAEKKKKTRENEYQREIEQIIKRTDALKAETAAQAGLNPLLNDYGFAVEFARAKQDLLTAAQEAGIKITPDLTKSIEGLAAGYANAVVASEQLAEKQDEIRQRAEEAMATAKDVTRGLIDGLIEGASAADLLKDSLKKIADTLLNDVLDSIFKVNKAGSGGGGFLSSIFGGLFGGGKFPAAPGGSGVPMYDDGGYTGDGGKYQPAGVVHKGEYVFDKAAVAAAGGPAVMDAMRRNLKGYSGGGLVGNFSAPRMPNLAAMSSRRAGQQMSQRPSTFVIDVRGATGNSEIQEMVAAGVQQGISIYDKQMPDRVQSINRNPRRR